jgi:MFS family permease
VLVVTAVVYTQETLDLAARADAAFALMTTSFSAGAVLGALLAHRLELRIGRPMLMAIGYLGPLFLIAAAFSPPMPVIYAAWFCLGLADAWAVISFQAYLAESVSDELRGRLYATWDAIVWLATAGAFSLMGVITPLLGAPATFGLVGLIVGLGGPLLLLVTGALRSIRQYTPAA